VVLFFLFFSGLYLFSFGLFLPATPCCRASIVELSTPWCFFSAAHPCFFLRICCPFVFFLLFLGFLLTLSGPASFPICLRRKRLCMFPPRPPFPSDIDKVDSRSTSFPFLSVIVRPVWSFWFFPRFFPAGLGGLSFPVIPFFFQRAEVWTPFSPSR